MAYLPGDIGQRIKELREQSKMSQAALAEVLHINKATLSRIESGETKTVGSDILMGLAEYFGVSVDFLVGFTCMPDPKNYSVDALRLSSQAAKAMMNRGVQMDILNRLLENPLFGQLTHTMFYALEPNQVANNLSKICFFHYCTVLSSVSSIISEMSHSRTLHILTSTSVLTFSFFPSLASADVLIPAALRSSVLFISRSIRSSSIE